MRRRDFVRNGVAARVAGVAFPRFLSDLARAQGASSRNLVLLNLSGGNDGLSTLVPYTDSFYYSRRPTLAIPAGTVRAIFFFTRTPTFFGGTFCSCCLDKGPIS